MIVYLILDILCLLNPIVLNKRQRAVSSSFLALTHSKSYHELKTSVAQVGFEPMTFGLLVNYSNNCAAELKEGMSKSLNICTGDNYDKHITHLVSLLMLRFQHKPSSRIAVVVEQKVLSSTPS